jgi:hypothetical protein
MTLQIVWRSPLPLIGTERTLQQVISDEFGAACAVRAADLVKEFEVIPDEAA